MDACFWGGFLNYRLQLVTPPAAEPLLVGGDAKLDVLPHLNLDPPDARGATYLNNLIKAARRWAENATNRCFIEQTWDLLLPHGFGWFGSGHPFLFTPTEIRIPRAPVKASGGIVSVKYLDTTGTQQTLVAGTDYVIAHSDDMTVILPAYGKSWPMVRPWVNAAGNYPVEVRLLAGYGQDGTCVPENFRLAMLLLLGHWNENREEVSEARLGHVPMAAEALLAQDVFVSW